MAENTKTGSETAAVAAVLFFIAAALVAPAVNAQLWNWFVAEPFGVLRLTYFHALGLSFAVWMMLKTGVLVGQLAEIKSALAVKLDWTKRAQRNAVSLAIQCAALGIGWLIHLGM